jgi:predicted dehydrogenase
MAVIPPTPHYEVMIVGHGFMGANHRNKIEALEHTRLAGIVDTDPSREVKGVPFYHSVEEGFKSLNPDIIVISSNSKTHFDVLSRICKLSTSVGKFPHILMEKPLVANGKQAVEAKQLLEKYPGKMSGGYLFRQSPIVADAVEYMKKEGCTIQKVTTLWQKDRVLKGPVRPSEGVHIDEATHPADLIINCILPQMGIDADSVTILDSSYKRQSVVGPIVDQKKQEELYKDEPEKLDPVAEVSYSLDVGGIPVSGFSSFKKGPQRREIEITLSDQSTLFLEFDVAGYDRLYRLEGMKGKTLISEHKCDKLMLEWEAFLEYCETGKKSFRTQTLTDMVFDVHLTEGLGRDLEHPYPIKH